MGAGDAVVPSGFNLDDLPKGFALDDVPRGTQDKPGLLSQAGRAIKDQWDMSAIKDELAGRKYPQGREPIELTNAAEVMMPMVMGPRGMMMLQGAPSSVSSFSNLPSAMQSAVNNGQAMVEGAGKVGGMALDAAKSGAGLLGKAAKVGAIGYGLNKIRGLLGH